MGKITTASPTPRRRSHGTQTRRTNIQAKSRKCLMCARVFTSEGAHNRICRRCKASQTYRSG